MLGELQVTQLCSRQEGESEEGLRHTLWILTRTNLSGVLM